MIISGRRVFEEDITLLLYTERVCLSREQVEDIGILAVISKLAWLRHGRSFPRKRKVTGLVYIPDNQELLLTSKSPFQHYYLLSLTIAASVFS